MPGLKVVAPATPADAKGLLKAAIRDDNPVIVLEGEMLYNTKGEVPEGEHVVPIGRAEVKRAGSDVTLICHSKTVTVALKAAEQLQEQNVSAEVLDLRSLRPMDEPAILESIAKTNRAVVMEEGRLVKWTKQEGDTVKTGETLAEVETDKAVMELVARADGSLVKILVPEGKTVPVGAAVAYIGAPGESIPDAGGKPASASTGMRDAGSVKPAPAATLPASATPQPVAPTDAARVKASPLARRLAREAGVDLRLVTGSGPGGRVTRRDLEGVAAPAPSPAPPAAAAPTHPASPIPHPPSGGAAFEDIPLTQIRKTIARRLVTSLGPIPH